MSWSESFLAWSINASLLVISAALVLVVVRIIRGPTLPDRILALDMLIAAVIGFIATMGVKAGYTLYVDIAIALGLVGFLSTVAFARFVLVRGRAGEEGGEGASGRPDGHDHRIEGGAP